MDDRCLVCAPVKRVPQLDAGHASQHHHWLCTWRLYQRCTTLRCGYLVAIQVISEAIVPGRCCNRNLETTGWWSPSCHHRHTFAYTARLKYRVDLECIQDYLTRGVGKKDDIFFHISHLRCLWVEQAFENCVVREWNLSYECLTGVAARSKLCGLWESNPEFWEELINVSPPDEEVPQPEDQDKPTPDSRIDDVDVPNSSPSRKHG